jgi:hypothetical protein
MGKRKNQNQKREGEGEGEGGWYSAVVHGGSWFMGSWVHDGRGMRELHLSAFVRPFGFRLQKDA